MYFQLKRENKLKWKENGNWIWNAGAIYNKQDFFYPFWGNFSKTIKIICLRWKLVPKLIQICWIRQWFSFVLFWTGNTFLVKFGPKMENWLIKMKFGTLTNSNMLNSMVMPKFSRWCSGPKNKNCLR